MAKRVLVVESQPVAAGEIASRLSRLGYDVEAVAATVAHAASLAIERTPDVAVVGPEFRDPAEGPSVAAALRFARPMPVVRLLAADPGEDASGDDPALPGPLDLVMPCTDRELRTTLELAVCRHHGARATHELERFFAVSQDMFCFLDFSGYFRRLNPAWERTLGWTREEMMARRFIEFVHPDDRERTLQQNGQVRGGGQARGFENRYLCRDGSHRWLLWNSSAASTSDRIIYAVARDITARKEAEDERARLIDELQASLAEVQTLQAILPICSYCRRIRDDKNYWESVEGYLARHTRTRFSHGICPGCMATEVEPQLARMERD